MSERRRVPLRQRLRRWWEEIGTPVADTESHPATLVDANTRTYWARGADAPETLVEAAAPLTPSPRRRVTALLDRHERGSAPVPHGRPRANPAFSEGVFVELMRASQYDRAFELLAPDCRHRWRSARNFVEAQRAGGALRHLQGARVTSVRHLDGWTDPDSGTTHRHVAELEVEYTLANGLRQTVVPRTVHLVGVRGRWMSLFYPDRASA